jgi:hypothetical protein
MRTLLLLLAASCLTLQTFAQLTVNFTINTAADRAPISPLIYGTNQILQSTDNYKSLRMGGNRITGLNWENNASNAGSDYFHLPQIVVFRGKPIQVFTIRQKTTTFRMPSQHYKWQAMLQLTRMVLFQKEKQLPLRDGDK